MGSVLRLLQSGNIRSYATWVLFGGVLVIVAMVGRGRHPMNLLLLIVLAMPLGGLLYRAGHPAVFRAVPTHVGLDRLARHLRRFPRPRLRIRPRAHGHSIRHRHPVDRHPGYSLHIGCDGISPLADYAVDIPHAHCVLVSWNSIQDRAKEFFAFLLLLEFGLIGVFIAQDLFLFYVFWEVTLVPMYFLIGIWGHDRRIYAALKFFLYTMAGSVLMLVAIIYLYNETEHVRAIRPFSKCCRAAVSRSRRRKACCSSSPSSLPSPSRSRSSRCIPGCPTRTWKRPPPDP